MGLRKKKMKEALKCNAAILIALIVVSATSGGVDQKEQTGNIINAAFDFFKEVMDYIINAASGFFMGEDDPEGKIKNFYESAEEQSGDSDDSGTKKIEKSEEDQKSGEPDEKNEAKNVIIETPTPVPTPKPTQKPKPTSTPVPTPTPTITATPTISTATPVVIPVVILASFGRLKVNAVSSEGPIGGRVGIYNEDEELVKDSAFVNVHFDLKPSTYKVIVSGSGIGGRNSIVFENVVVSAEQETSLTARFGRLKVNAVSSEGPIGGRVGIYNEDEELVKDSAFVNVHFDLKPSTYKVIVSGQGTEIVFENVVVSAEEEKEVTASFCKA